MDHDDRARLSVSRWIKPERDRERRIVKPGRWLVLGQFDEKRAEKELRAVAAAGGTAQAIGQELGMRAGPRSFERWTGSGGRS